EAPSRNSFRIDPARPEDFQWLLDQVRESGGPPLRGVIHLWGVADAAPEEMTLDGLKIAQVLGTGAALHLVQALAPAEWLRQPRLWLATRGAQPVDSALSARSIAQSPLWGLSRVISLEWPELRCVTVDLDPSNPPNEPDEVDAFALELSAGGGEDQVAFR